MSSENNQNKENNACGPGYKSPSDAIRSAKETILYTVLIYCGSDPTKADCLATIDVDKRSPTYSKVIHKLEMPYTKDELHHFGWNACSSCCHDKTKSRRYLVLVGFLSSRIYIVDTIDPKKPSLHKIVEPEEIKAKVNLSAPHTVHCLANGKIMISMLGDRDGNAPGGFLLLDERFNIAGKTSHSDNKEFGFNYDFWYQPYHNIMVSSEWAAPNTFVNGFNPAHVAEKKYGENLYFWNWKEEKLIKKVNLGDDGKIPLELRFLHNPKSTHGYVGATLSSSIWHWYQDVDNDWKVEKVIQLDALDVPGWPIKVPPLITDVLISMDDKFLYFVSWFHGDIRQYDISDPHKPKLVGQVFIGGLIGKEYTRPASNVKLHGGPQMIQLSLDGKRLYVTNSLFSPWDDQFYPDIAMHGSSLLMINCDTDKGGLSIDEKFYVNFVCTSEDDTSGPYRAHEMRYPGGDCTSDIWIE